MGNLSRLCTLVFAGLLVAVRAEDGIDILPREYPLTPKDSLATIEVAGPYRLELVAAEPLVRDPVDVAFDEQGRMFVAEMRDYPDPRKDGYFESRIRLLLDRDGDGIPDRGVTWAGNLDHVQGLCRVQGGFLVTTRVDVLFLKDTTGDDRADHREVLFRVNDPKHNQLSVSSPRWGPDNAIYLNNGLDGREIYPDRDPKALTKFERLNLRLDPRDWSVTTVPGRGQYGGTFDDWGHHFYCSNRNPVMMTVMPLHAMKRNRFFPITAGHEDIAPTGGEAKVYPLILTHTTAAFHAGSYTAACGMAVYRGDLMPDLLDHVLVCEPPGQLVTLSKLVPNGASMKAERVFEGKDFIASTDEWFRPVNLRNGPDGALYLCDMYRRFIDHARFFPAEFAKKHDFHAGTEQGRIYRLVPQEKKDVALPAARPLPEEVAELVPFLGHPSAWHRIHAQRLLVESGGGAGVAGAIRKVRRRDDPRAQIHAEWTIRGSGADPAGADAPMSLQVEESLLTFARRSSREGEWKPNLDNARLAFLEICNYDQVSDPELPSKLASVARRFPGDPWIQKAIVTAAELQGADILRAVSQKADPRQADLLRDLARVTAAKGKPNELRRLFSLFEESEGDVGRLDRWARFAILEGMTAGFRSSKGPSKSLVKAMEATPTEHAKGVAAVRATLESAREVAVDDSLSVDDRVAAVPLLQSLSIEPALAALGEIFTGETPPKVRRAALAVMPRFQRNKVGGFLFDHWVDFPPDVQQNALVYLCASTQTTKDLLQRMKDGSIPPGILPAEQRWRLGRSKDGAIKKLVLELFGKASEDRVAVLKDYGDALTLEGDASRGQEVFRTNCLVCHRIGGEGMNVGPDISDVRIKAPEALLSDILDPNRVVETRWMAVNVETKDGLAFPGILESESADSVSVRIQGGALQTIARSRLKSLKPTGRSLMPVGFEGAVSKQQMADLLAFLKGKSPKSALREASASAMATADRPADRTVSKPNIVFIFVDNLGYGDIEPFGSKLIKTPNLNRMAAEGRKFTHYYATAGVCTPSRASAMTGCYAQRVGMHWNERDVHVLRPISPYGLNPGETTIAEALKKEGYATACFGKWHLGDQPEFLPTRQGFDSYYGIPYSDDMTAREWTDGTKWPPLPLMEDEKVVEAPADRDTLTRRYTERALSFIEQNKERPFFLYLPMAMPGSTRQPFATGSFKGKSKAGPWGDSVEELDWSAGQILDKLKALGLSRKTLVIWTSDNGAPMSRGKEDYRGSNGPLFGRGYTTSEGGFRIPMIAWWPERIPAGSTCEEMASTMDLLPTFAALAGGESPEVDGFDVRPLLFAEKNARSPYGEFYYYHRDQLHAVRSGPWKLFLPVENPMGHPRVPRGHKGPVPAMLFHLYDDVGCKNDVAAANPDIVARLTKIGERAREDLGDRERAGKGQRERGRVENPTPRVME